MLTPFEQAMAADAAAIYAGEFAEDVAFVGPQGQTAPARGIFDLTYIEADMDTGAPVQTTKPRLSLWAPSIPWELKQEQIVIIRGVRYTIRSVDRQGDTDASGQAPGSVVLILNKAAKQ
jgi:hypothetical protein